MSEHDPQHPKATPPPERHEPEPTEGRDVRTPMPERKGPPPPPDAHTRPAPEAGTPRPDQDEDLGPAAELFGAAATEAAAEAGSEEAKAEAAREGAEPEGVEAAQILGLMIATIVAIALAIIGVFFLVDMSTGREAEARSSGLLYVERAEVERAAADRLGNYAREDTLYRIPIDAAMTQVARRYNQRQAGADVVEPPAYFNSVEPRPAAATVGAPRPPQTPEPGIGAADPRTGADVADESAEPADETAPATGEAAGGEAGETETDTNPEEQ